jgi:predicted lysophospholipase L1 biosynthesis ABC-type transport system permease subunit
LGVAALIAAALNARKRSRHDTEMASLRLLGLTRGQITGAGLVELGFVGAALAIVGGLGGVLAVLALLPTLPLVKPPDHGLPLEQGVLWWPPLVAGCAAALVWCLVGWRTARVVDSASRPATLREEAGG